MVQNVEAVASPGTGTDLRSFDIRGLTEASLIFVLTIGNA